MKLIIGLGNPGKKYEKTRHNTGFMTVNKIASALQTTPYNLRPIFNAEISEGTVNGQKIILAKPQTFMNESGKSVKVIAEYYKIRPDNVIVIHDDMDISLGEYKIVRNRSSAGHKGVQSIVDALETKDFTRIRIGIGIKDKKIPTEAFVLENFAKDEQKIITKVIVKACGETESLI